MASLVIITQETRTVLKYGAIISVFLVLLFFIIKGLIYVQNVIFPKAPIAPKQEFGKLPKLVLPTQDAVGITYRINTVNGTLPKLPLKANVYQLIQPQPDLLALNRTGNLLVPAFFTGVPVKITDRLYQWTNQQNGTNLQYDIVSKNFTISSDYLDNPNLSSTALLPDEKKIKNDTFAFLSSLSANKDDIDLDKSSVTYLQLNSRLLTSADSLGNAKYARVDLRQKAIDDLSFTYTSPMESILSFIVSYPNGNFTVLEGQYFHYIPDLEKKSDYPIKTSEQAYEDLKNGNAIVMNPLNLKDVEITSIELLYYLNKNTDVYLEPIILLKGINFSAYVDAITSDSLN